MIWIIIATKAAHMPQRLQTAIASQYKMSDYKIFTYAELF